ncbi:lipoprotein [Ferrigenium kumadai]|uniref:Endolytic peptidoglycan transglycosylase RlpA n=1 Tax=Ferrigenium kumadai TaxID=1682490 RepID=A0AAN1SXJ1_9PROT|nr:septal ring lytic transglycosylase RlpA family protein [Ferrigenium kumadai]BBI98452.1 lipoprotein [Ferrigenium kumadai]
MSRQIAILALAMTLAACGSTPQRQVETRSTPAPVESRVVGTPGAAPVPGSGGYLAGDGPGADVPANLDVIPDAVPRSEPLHRYANRPYVALGKTYTPLTVSGNFKERGIASWYGKKFHGQRTSSGEVYDMYGMSAAHPTLPIPSYARVTSVASGKSVVVRVNDRGPFLHDRVMDLSYTAAHKIGIIGNGSAEVEIESLSPNAVVNSVAKVEPVQSRPLEKAEPAKSASSAPVAAGNVYLQLGAFKSQEAAESFVAKMRAELGEAGKQITLFVKDGLTRVHLGPYASPNEARSSAEGLQGKLGFKPMVNLH